MKKSDKSNQNARIAAECRWKRTECKNEASLSKKTAFVIYRIRFLAILLVEIWQDFPI